MTSPPSQGIHVAAAQVSLDLAKNVFQAHDVDEHGAVTPTKQFKHLQVNAFFAQLPSAVAGMEACSGTPHWYRALNSRGHEVRILAAGFACPYVKSNKNDEPHAAAICDAVERPNMRFVAQDIEQQDVLSLHRAHKALVGVRAVIRARQIGPQAENRLARLPGRRHEGCRDGCCPQKR
jgi:transposase